MMKIVLCNKTSTIREQTFLISYSVALVMQISFMVSVVAAWNYD